MTWTKEELAEMAEVDAEIGWEEIFDAKDKTVQRLAACYRAYYEFQRENLAVYKRLYWQWKKAEKEARDAMDSGGTG